MSPLLITNIRMSTDTKDKGNIQASKLGLNLSEYIRLIIELDSATELLAMIKDGANKNLKREETKENMKNVYVDKNGHLQVKLRD